MTSLIRASDEGAEIKPTNKNTMDGSHLTHPRGGLTKEEIYGNMFIFNFAGHDTTAQPLIFTINLLAAHTEIQDWMKEELDYYLPDDTLSNWSYEKVFLKLKRCLAVLVSTLVSYNPRVSLTSCTSIS